MIIKIRIAHWRFTLTLAPVTNVAGVNSKLKDGNHIIMWDFDDTPLNKVAHALKIVQLLYDLPPIYILNSGKKDHYIAYSFARLPWRASIEIVAATPYVDPNFFKYGVYREKWTLRVTPKEGRKPKAITTLGSRQKEQVSISELSSWVKDTKENRTLQGLFSLFSNLGNRLGIIPLQICLDVSAYNTRHSQTTHQ